MTAYKTASGSVSFVAEANSIAQQNGTDALSLLNTNTQAAAVSAGVAASVNPLAGPVAIVAGINAALTQGAVFGRDAENGADLQTLGNDLIGVVGDVAIAGGALAEDAGLVGLGNVFAGLGATLDAYSAGSIDFVSLSNSINNAISQAESVGAAAFNAIGDALSQTGQDLSGLEGQSADPDPTGTAESGISNIEGSDFMALAQGADVRNAVLIDGSSFVDGSNGDVELVDPNVTTSVNGVNNTIFDANNGDIIKGVSNANDTTFISGTDDVYTDAKTAAVAHGTDTVDVTGTDSSVTIHTTPDVLVTGDNDTVTPTGQNVDITDTSGTSSIAATGDSHDTIYFENGTDNAYYTEGQSSDGANRVELDNSGTSATIYNTPVVSMDGDNQSVDLMSRGAYIYVPAGETGDVIDGRGYTVYEGGNDQVTLEGSGYSVVNDTRRNSNGSQGIGTNGVSRGGTSTHGGATTSVGGVPTSFGGGGGGGGTTSFGSSDDFSKHARALRRQAGAHTSSTHSSAVNAGATAALGNSAQLSGTKPTSPSNKSHTSAKLEAREALNQARAAVAGADLPSAGATPSFEGPKWGEPAVTSENASSPASKPATITWSFATGAINMPDNFSGHIGATYKATVEKAVQVWAAASGLNFVEVPDSASSDIRIGWGDLNTPSSGLLGKTTYKASGGVFKPGTIIRLEDPSQDALRSIKGQATYAGTGATLYQVVLHEIGHALGLADDSDTSSVMYAESLKTNRTLDATDIAGIQSLYGASPTSPSGTSTPLATVGSPGPESSPATASPAAAGLGVNQMIQAMASFTSSSPAGAATMAAASAYAAAAPTLAASAHH